MKNIYEERTEKAEAARDEARRKYKRAEDYIEKMDAVIDDCGIAKSCINPLEDLKRATTALKERAEKAEAQLAEYKRLSESGESLGGERGYRMKIELTPAVIACLKRGLNCWPEQNFADGAEIRDILRMNLRLVEALASQEPLATTHYSGCYDGGQKHYECALLKIKQLVEPMMEFKTPTKVFGPNLEQVLNAAGFYRKKEWVGLTEEEKHDCYLKIDVWSRCVEAVEAKLKEKNGG